VSLEEFRRFALVVAFPVTAIGILSVILVVFIVMTPTDRFEDGLPPSMSADLLREPSTAVPVRILEDGALEVAWFPYVPLGELNDALLHVRYVHDASWVIVSADATMDYRAVKATLIRLAAVGVRRVTLRTAKTQRLVGGER